MLAALVGAVVEAARFTVAFPSADEPADAALVRVRPLAAVLLEASHGSAGSDLFVSRARRLSVPVLVFGGIGTLAEKSTWARSQGLEAFAMPDDLPNLEIALERLIPDAHRPRAGLDRRGFAQRQADGTLVFTDAKGARWSVYDRRRPDRRNMVDRRFVNDVGEVRHCDISEQEARLVSAATLAEQLQRSESE